MPPVKLTSRARKPSAPSAFAVIEHTADMGIRAWGPSPADAFAQAAMGMFAIALGDASLRVHRTRSGPSARTVDVKIEASDWEQLLVAWLSDLLTRFEVDGVVPIHVDIREITATSLSARLSVARLPRRAHPPGTAIKGVTYHQLAVDVGEARSEIAVIFDI